ncbi:hypothetical protein POTOM_055121 [Populus tomentosa]|uniref:Uncharacterized protein n=1 Tax=Populus tomentosa TaxID=118781 RepID=A0A8X7Y3P7_POPTO|nr:hypothetical protein POTOM_055121 [Populus tomentosa]
MKSLSLSVLTLSLLLTMMLLNTKSCGASISLPEMDGDSIADSNIDLEFMMDSEINRILNAGSRPAGTTGGLPAAYLPRTMMRPGDIVMGTPPLLPSFPFFIADRLPVPEEEEETMRVENASFWTWE